MCRFYLFPGCLIFFLPLLNDQLRAAAHAVYDSSVKLSFTADHLWKKNRLIPHDI